MKTYKGTGDRIPWTNSTGVAVVSGQVVALGALIGVAVADIAINATGVLEIAGEHELPATTTDEWAVGDVLYWNATTGKLTDTAQALLAGHATSTKTNCLTVASVKLGRSVLNATVADSVATGAIVGTDASLAVDGLAAAQGGAIVVKGGTSSTGGNAGGAVSLTGGTPGVTGVGGAAAVAGGPGGATSGTGGAASLAGGAGTAGNANGGAVSVLGGNAHGIGTDGAANIGTSNTSAVNVAAAGIPTNIGGPVTASLGDSTAAAGSTVADAGALPAGTGMVYPTTDANDTKGVVINAADKVTGRMIFIGNGVANKILKVYGPSGAAINGGSADAAFSSVSGKGVIAVCLSSGDNTWLMW